jgi:hypothetical protein
MKIETLYHNTPIQALPPEHQIAREKEAILNDPRFLDLLNGRGVVSIEKTREDRYQVILDSGEPIEVKIHYLPSGIGPAKFELEFEDTREILQP